MEQKPAESLKGKDTGNCIVCGNTFQYRKGKQYCCNACKQKAFTKGLPFSVPVDTEVLPLPNGFSLREYREYVDRVGYSFPLIHYFFLRRNLESNVSIDEIEFYLNGLYSDHFFSDNFIRSEPYKEFEKDFLDNKYILSM